jgi:hypothetical protein
VHPEKFLAGDFAAGYPERDGGKRLKNFILPFIAVL